MVTWFSSSPDGSLVVEDFPRNVEVTSHPQIRYKNDSYKTRYGLAEFSVLAPKGFYFFDEKAKYYYGPFDTQEEADEAYGRHTRMFMNAK